MRTFAIVAAAALIVSTSSADAMEIDAMITTAMNAAIEELAPPFERASGHVLSTTMRSAGSLPLRRRASPPEGP